MKKAKKILLFVVLAILLIGGGVAGYIYSITSIGFDIDKTAYIHIDSKKDYNKLLKDIEEIAKVKSISSFKTVASVLDYSASSVKTGRYAVSPNMNIMDVIKRLRIGEQSPTKLKFNNIRLKEDLADRVSEQLMFSKEDLLAVLNDSEQCSKYGFNDQTIVAMFIPNTYEFYWDVSVDVFLTKMSKEYEKFWTEERLKKAEDINLSSLQVSTLASIVEEECTYSDEYPMVAGLYLNRLEKGQPLQADPTVKFAVGDFSLRRILNKHLEVESPYNTYKHSGLPPSPIRIPSIKGIDAVLNYAKHDYYYMCAKEDFSGRHNFASTFSQHQQNASRYWAALNARGIR